MSRIFILGDSFADNLYSKEKESIDAGYPLGSGIARYVDTFIKNKITLPLYFDDWLKEWGYEVYNYGIGEKDGLFDFNESVESQSSTFVGINYESSYYKKKK